tara:strand:+ start:9178 stop:9720 length:543 start_codon:yes stop_codon:yes gene_type:complete
MPDNSTTLYNKFARSESPYASNSNEDVATFSTATAKYVVAHGSSPAKSSKFVTFREADWFKKYLAKNSSDIGITVTVASGTNSYGGGNKYYFGGTVSPAVGFVAGKTYVFNQSDSSNSGHPLQFSIVGNGSHAGGAQYTTGVTVSGTAGNAGATVTIVISASTPTLHYYCPNHSGMGSQA